VAAPRDDHFPVAALGSGSSEPAERPNTLAPGFLIRLSHQEDRDLNGTFRIEFDGKINLPYNVSFRAQGLTMDEFRQKVLESYKPFYKGGMRLAVELVEKAYFVELRGLIKKPGRYKVKGDTSLDEVISLGDGFPAATDSQPRFLKITRGESSRLVNLEDYYKSGGIKANAPWHGGEILFFQKDSGYSDPGSLDAGSQIQVLGELKKPGEFGHRPGADVYFYMAEAGGPTRDTDFDKVQIFRGPLGKRTMMEFALDEPEKVPAIQPGDILVFRSDNPSKFQKSMGAAANVAAVISAIALLVIAL
jgi:protein involved in polysaccharide export with SLBB domain